VTLERAIRVDRVDLQIPRGQHFPRYSYSYRDTGGAWRGFEPEISEEYAETTEQQRKRQAYRALRSLGVEYLTSNVDDGGHNIVAKPIQEDPASWGLEELWREGPHRLYRLLPDEP
jgi:hypothetical protein